MFDTKLDMLKTTVASLITKVDSLQAEVLGLSRWKTFTEKKAAAEKLIAQATSLGLPKYQWTESAMFSLVIPESVQRIHRSYDHYPSQPYTEINYCVQSFEDFETQVIQAAGKKHITSCPPSPVSKKKQKEKKK